MSTIPMRLGELLEQLGQHNLTVRADYPLPTDLSGADLSGANDAESSPWYIKALVGVAAWIAAFFLAAFLGVAGLIDSTESMMVLGAVLVVIAVVLRRLTRHSIFWGQLAFAVVLAGQGLLIAGVGSREFDITMTALFVVLLEVVIFALYPDALHRMLSVMAITGAITVILYEQDLRALIHGLIFLLAVGTVAVWQQEFRLLASRWFPVRAPLGYGLALSLFALCLLTLVDYYGVTLWWQSAAGLALVLLYLAYRLLGELDRPLVSPVGLWALVAVALLLVPAYQTPGILAAMIVLLLGFWRNNVLLMGLATLFLLFFLSAYYYNLDITLLNKSYILMGTGVVLLALRFAFHWVVGGPTVDSEQA